MRWSSPHLKCPPWIRVLLWWWLSVLTVTAAPKRVLILNPHTREVEPFAAVVSAFRSTLAREVGEPVDFLEIPLDLARFTEPEGEGALVAFLEQHLARQAIDLVVPIGGAGAQFAGRHRERLFPATPVLLVAADTRFVPPGFLERNATFVTQQIDLAGFVRDILAIKPGTANLAVVMGNAPVEQFWLEACRREFAVFGDRLKFIWLDQLPLDEVVRRCAALPPDSFIFHAMFIVDGEGISCEKNEALLRLLRTGNAPVFALFESEFGLGPVGGRLYRNVEIGELSARTAVRILQGEPAGSIPPLILEAGSPRYDWRELKRWGIKEENLPPDSMVFFRQPGFWEQYRGIALGGLALALVQSGLIFGLWSIGQNASGVRRRRS